MLLRVKENNGQYFACADNGTLVSILKAYHAAKDKGLKLIPGIELYFKDENCEIINGTPSQQAKYFKLLVYFKDQPAYQQMVKMVSERDRKRVDIGKDHRYPLFIWSDLELLAQFNVLVSSSGIEDMVSKHLLFDRHDLASKYYEKLVKIFGDRYTPSICTFEHTHYQDRVVKIHLSGGKTIQVPINTRVETNSKAFKNKAVDIFNAPYKHQNLYAVYYNGVKAKIKRENQGIVKAEMVKTFIPFATGDLQRLANEHFLKIHAGGFLINDNAYYVDKTDKIVQNMKLGEDGRFLQPDLHVKDSSEVALYLKSLGLDVKQILEIFENTNRWASNFDSFGLKYDIKLVDYGQEPEKLLIEAIKNRGRMKWDDPRYVKQLREEMDLLVNNGVINLVPYFLPLIEIGKLYSDNNRLVGIGRGSSSGFLISYLSGITQIDPIRFGLSSARFLTLDRVQQHNLPDIDYDTEGRDLLEGDKEAPGYFKERFGDCYAPVSTRGLLRLKSAILDANRFVYGEIQSDIQKLTKSLPTTPQGVSDYDYIFGYEKDDEHVPGLFDTNEDLQKYAAARPEEWSIVTKAVSLVRQNGIHACAKLLSPESLSNIIPLTVAKNGEIVTQFEAKECEKAGLIKYDFLVISVLKDIRMTLDLINKKNGHKCEVGNFEHCGQQTYIWDLPEDQDVYQMMSRGETETVFQFNTTSVIPFIEKIQPRSVVDLSTITALVRPGPLSFVDKKSGRNMAEEYIERRFGRSVGEIEILNKMIPETYGTIVFQEQISRIAIELGKMEVIDAENVRIAMGKKKIKLMDSLKPKFIAGAIKTVDEATANTIWDMMAAFAKYSFNNSHSLAYAITGYACAFLKYHYPLEWWASVLTNADSKEINEKFYKYVKDMLLPPDINLSEEEITIDYENRKLRQKLSAITGLGGKVAEKIMELRPFADLKDFVKKKPCGPSMTRKLIYIGAMDSLMPAEADTMLKKMWAYEEMIKQVDFEDKMAGIEDLDKRAKAEKKGRAKAKIDPSYIVVDPLKDYLIKKEICPTMNLDLYDLIGKYATKLQVHSGTKGLTVVDAKGYNVYLGGPVLLEKMDDLITDNYTNFCVPGYVIDASVFTYAKNTKKAYKLIIDSSGYISEKVIWSDYDTGELKYPKSLEKGCLAFFFYQKRPGKRDCNIYHVVVEVEALN
jgi:DNA-directed DNA polymerase III PolC